MAKLRIEIQRSRDVWLIAQDKEPWRDLPSQLGYFGVRVDYFTWQHLPGRCSQTRS